MKIRFLEDTYIRIAPTKSDNSPIGTVFKGSEIEVDPTMVQGEPIDYNNHWYRDKNGWYYWSGRVERVKNDKEADSVFMYGGIQLTPSLQDVPEIQPDIPEGETRWVPDLEELQEVDKKQQLETRSTPVLTLRTNQLLRSMSNQPTIPQNVVVATERSLETAPPDPSSEKTPLAGVMAPEKLNWAIQSYLIAKNWWQERHITGNGIRIAVLSTGLSEGHPDLPMPSELFQMSGTNEPMSDKDGLGTHAAEVIAGKGLQYVFGVAPGAQLLVGKIGEQDHSITNEGLLAGLQWAIEAGADIIAMLVDFPRLQETTQHRLQNLIDKAIDKDIILVAPVGTMENKKPENRYPACLDGVFSVGAHDQQGKRCTYSVRSNKLDLLAPGEGLLVSEKQGLSKTILKSTSLAAAFAAGFIALVLQWYRNKGIRIKPTEMYALLKNSAAFRQNFNTGTDNDRSYGILNPIEVLKRLEDNNQH